jgi:hypothetical protein
MIDLVIQIGIVAPMFNFCLLFTVYNRVKFRFEFL